MTRDGHWATTPEQLASIELCRSVTRDRAANFACGLRLAREPKRSALYALYAWTRQADDLADEPGATEDRAAALAAYGERTRAAISGDLDAWADLDGVSIWPAVSGAARAYRLDPGLFEALLEGMRSDLGGVCLETESELETYCYRVASTVGLLCVAIWGLGPGTDHAEASRLAALRGRAFQLTNILRDFAEDYDDEPRRIYIPIEAFRAAGLEARTLRAWSEARACRAFVARRVAIARRAYDDSAALDAMVSLDGRPVLRALTGVYRALLERVARAPERVGTGPAVRVPRRVKIWIATKAVGGAGAARLAGGTR